MATLMKLERLFALLLVCMENLIHGGIISGWPSLVFVFIQLGYFRDLCSESSENVTSTSLPNTTMTTTTVARNLSQEEGLISCPEQESRLQLVFSIAVALHVTCMFPVGFLFDHFGTRLSRVVMSILMLIGYVVMAFSSPTYPNLVFPGTICFTIGGVIMLFSSMQVGNLFGEKKSTVITLINGLYSGSVIVFFVVKIAYDAGFSINIFFFILAGSVVLLNLNTFIFLPTKYIPWPLPEGYRLITCCTPRTIPKTKEEGACDNQGYVEEIPSEITGVDGTYKRNGVNTINGKFGRSGSITRMMTTKDPSSISEVEDRKRKEYSSLGSCIMSMPFFTLLIWQAFLEIDFVFTIGTVNFFLTRLSNGDQDLVSWYTDVFAISQFVIIVVCPLGGLLMDRHSISMSCSKSSKKHKERGPYADMRDSCLPLAITTFASIGYSICLLIPSLQLQYLTFILILIMKSLLFGVGSATVAVVFPMEYFTSVYGAIRTISGFISFLQYPIFIVIQNYLNDDPFWVTIAFIIADVLTFILPASLYIRSRKKSSTNDEQ